MRIKSFIPGTICCLIFSMMVSLLIAQNRVSGLVIDAETSEPLIGVNILLQGTVKGTITDLDGSYSIEVSENLPYSLVFSLVGFQSQIIEVTDPNAVLNVQLGVQAFVTDEIVVSASRVEEKILESPVSVEKLDQLAIQASTSSDYYDEITKLKGVSNVAGSLTFNSINSRGFAAHANNRFVQLIDGMDNSSAILNFPTGNITGIGLLDIRNVELIPGTASALYGPNAFNGILLMNSKSPFEYQGLSAQVKFGMTDSEAAGTKPNYGFDFRYANSTEDDRFAYKINFSYFDATDWYANDYETDRNLLRRNVDDPTINPQGNQGAPNFDGLNLYGDETQITVPFSPFKATLISNLVPVFVNMGVPQNVAESIISDGIDNLAPITVTRTGIGEQELLESNKARSVKGDIALHYRLSNNWEASYLYKYGNGSAIYQGSERYALRDFVQQYHKFELKNPNFMLRAYISLENDGDSYNMSALGAFANEAFSPTRTQWLPTYLGTYAATVIGTAFQNGVPIPQLPQVARDAAHAAARAMSDAPIPAVGSPEFNAVVEQVRSGLFQQGGAGFIDDSNLKHAEFTYDLSSKLGGQLDILVGANIRQYDLFSDGTVYNEDPEGTGNNERIKYEEWGAFIQAQKHLGRFSFTGSVRYDKNELFEGQFTPKIAGVYSIHSNRQHFIRASYQTGFRNPTTQDLFLYFPAAQTLLGFSEQNAERYGLHGGGAYTEVSYNNFLTSVLAGAPNSALLEEINLNFLKPERLTSLELGYKGVFKNKFFVDINYYLNHYKDFIGAVNVVAKTTTSHKGQPLYGVDALLAGETVVVFRPTVNIDQEFDSWGIGLGLGYDLGEGYRIAANGAWSRFKLDEESPFDPGFNTPEYDINISISNRKLTDNLGANLNFRWQESFVWSNAFGTGNIPALSSLDAQISYKIPSAKATIKLGGKNLLGDNYRTNVGGPFVGSHYYVSITYDQFSN